MKKLITIVIATMLALGSAYADSYRCYTDHITAPKAKMDTSIPSIVRVPSTLVEAKGKMIVTMLGKRIVIHTDNLVEKDGDGGSTYKVIVRGKQTGTITVYRDGDLVYGYRFDTNKGASLSNVCQPIR